MPKSSPDRAPRQAPQGASSSTGETTRISRPSPRSSASARTPSRQSPTPDLLSVVHLLQPRDHVIAGLLVEHRTLTTDQLAAVLFDTASTARARLYRLRQLGWVDRFTPVRAGQRRQTHWVAGLLAARYHAVQHATATPTPRVWRDRVEAIAASTHLGHTVGANQVFVDLLAHTRTHPHKRLARWWGPARTAAAVGQRVHPDGHGVWTDRTDRTERQVGFWLEYDTGTEPLARLVAKLDPYTRLRRSGGPDYPVLFHLPTPAREANLHDRLTHAHDVDGAADGGVTVATTTPDAVTPAGLAGPVWRVVGTDQRCRLIDLPSSPGRPGPYHPGPPTPEQDPLALLAVPEPDEPDATAARQLVDEEPN